LLDDDHETDETTAVAKTEASALMDWLENGVFCGVLADGCARKNGYNSEERRFLRRPCREVISGIKDYDLKGSVEKISVRESWGSESRRIGGKRPLVK
jgi:hypothetical protein